MNKAQDAVLGIVETGLTIITAYLALRVIVGPDKLREIQMRAWRYAENRCQREAEMWALLADSCAKHYERCRVVTV